MESENIPSTEPVGTKAPAEEPAAAHSTPAQPLTGPALHSGPPDYETYRYGYPPGQRMFGSGN